MLTPAVVDIVVSTVVGITVLECTVVVELAIDKSVDAVTMVVAVALVLATAVVNIVL